MTRVPFVVWSALALGACSSDSKVSGSEDGTDVDSTADADADADADIDLDTGSSGM